MSAKDIARGLTAFAPGDDNPGRANLQLAGTSPVLVDYGHNAAALEATGRLVRDVWAESAGRGRDAARRPARRPAGAERARRSRAGSRPWCCMRTATSAAAQTGEMLTLIGAALRAARPGIVCRSAENPADALRAALDLADGGPVLFVYEKLALANDALVAVGAQPWPAERSSDISGRQANTIRPGTGSAVPADAAEAAVAVATALVAGAADAATPRQPRPRSPTPAAAVVASAAAAAITRRGRRRPCPASPAHAREPTAARPAQGRRR